MAPLLLLVGSTKLNTNIIRACLDANRFQQIVQKQNKILFNFF
jgi:N-formylglutamate amidohydrolase